MGSDCISSWSLLIFLLRSRSSSVESGRFQSGQGQGNDDGQDQMETENQEGEGQGQGQGEGDDSA